MLIAQGLTKKYGDLIALNESTSGLDPQASNEITLNELEKLHLKTMKTGNHAAANN